MRKLFVALSVAAVSAAMAVPSQAAANTVIAGPGAQTVGYATPVVVVVKAGPANFVNLDPLTAHNVVSEGKKSNGQALFRSNMASAGQAVAIEGVADLAPGDYAFKCQPHPSSMTGTLRVVA